MVKDNHVLNHYEYDVWGNLTVCEETVENRFKYNGQQFDPISQQYYLRARYYKPVIGRFTQEDTYRGDGLNLYAYCRNNPVFYIDPSGHMCEKGVDRVTGEINTRTATKDDVKNLSSHIREKLRNGGTLTDQECRVANQLGIDVGRKTSYGKSSGKAKTGPKPQGTGAHNLKIEEIASQVTDGTVIAGGGRICPNPEAIIQTPNGLKKTRRPDILVQRPDGTLYGINVGKTTAKGAPIKREAEALYDLEDHNLPMYFVGYDK